MCNMPIFQKEIAISVYRCILISTSQEANTKGDLKMNTLEALEKMEKIQNSTVAKLTSDEAQLFGLTSIGFGFYKGELKTRYNGMKRTSVDGVTFSYEGEKFRIDFTEMMSNTEERHWDARIYNKAQGHWEVSPMGIIGCDFFR